MHKHGYCVQICNYIYNIYIYIVLINFSKSLLQIIYVHNIQFRINALSIQYTYFHE